MPSWRADTRQCWSCRCQVTYPRQWRHRRGQCIWCERRGVTPEAWQMPQVAPDDIQHLADAIISTTSAAASLGLLESWQPQAADPVVLLDPEPVHPAAPMKAPPAPPSAQDGSRAVPWVWDVHRVLRRPPSSGYRTRSLLRLPGVRDAVASAAEAEWRRIETGRFGHLRRRASKSPQGLA